MLRRTMPLRRAWLPVPIQANYNMRLRYSSTQQSSPVPPPTETRSPQAEEEETRRPNIYKQLGRPFAKVFLSAMLTYQVLYWSWEKMRMEEIREERNGEIKQLEREVEEYSRGKASA